MKLTVFAMVAILRFAVLMAIITTPLCSNLVAGNMDGEDRDERH